MSEKSPASARTLILNPVPSSGLFLSNEQRQVFSENKSDRLSTRPVDIDAVLDHFGLPRSAIIRVDRSNNPVPYDYQLQQLVALIISYMGTEVPYFNTSDGTMLITPQQQIVSLFKHLATLQKPNTQGASEVIIDERIDVRDRVAGVVIDNGIAETERIANQNLQSQKAAMAAMFSLMGAARSGEVDQRQLELLREQLSFETLPSKLQQQYVTMLTLMLGQKYSETLAAEIRRVKELVK